jgi:hypothetical protein
MLDKEIILNLWYLYDELGAIYSLRARAYVGTGSDDEKLDLLRTFAPYDYLIAQPFPVPERFHTTIDEGGTRQRLPVAMCQLLPHYGSECDLFEDAFQAIEAQLPVQTDLVIPEQPLVCITPIRCTDDGSMQPQTSRSRRF